MSMLERGRAAAERRSWAQARDLLVATDGEAPLEIPDLVLLAMAAQLSGHDDLSDSVRKRVIHRCEAEGDVAGAARSSVFLGLALLNRGEHAQGGAWIGRACELAETLEPRCADRGYAMVTQALGTLNSGAAAEALPLFEEVLSIGTECGDRDLSALGRLGAGQTMLALGQIDAGLASLDRAMVAVVADEVSSWVAGIVSCGVVEACHDIGDLARSREWTRALSDWCDAQPDLVPFRGRCLVHRSEILQLDGSWGGATDEAKRACTVLSHPPGQPPLGAALYQLAEMQRLHGEMEAAAQSYLQASEHGRDPQPGLALLRLASGEPAAAADTLARVLDEGHLVEQRPRILAAHVEVALAAGRLDAAERSADELTEAAASAEAAPSLTALAATARGQVALAAKDPRAALADLRLGAAIWGELGAVYEIARSRELIGRACGLLGDLDTADLELSAARATYERLGATTDVQRVADASPGPDPADPGVGLTGRELEVLRQVSSGQTNRQIAEKLFISEKTVARHVSNIFTKLGVPSRAAATAYAYEHDLV